MQLFSIPTPTLNANPRFASCERGLVMKDSMGEHVRIRPTIHSCTKYQKSAEHPPNDHSSRMHNNPLCLTNLHSSPNSLTLLTASKKSFSVTVFRLARIANIPASVHTDRISAPVVLGHNLASSSNRMPLSQFIPLEWILKIWVLESRSGRANSTFRSSRPGRRIAGSSVSGRLVAIRTFMLPRDSKPSSWLTISNIVR